MTEQTNREMTWQLMMQDWQCAENGGETGAESFSQILPVYNAGFQSEQKIRQIRGEPPDRSLPPGARTSKSYVYFCQRHS
jgi:hypothetical protein